MKNAEMKLVRLDSTDVIATSGPGGDWLQFANLGDGNPGNETFTGSFMGKSLNFTNDGKQGDIPTYLETLDPSMGLSNAIIDSYFYNGENEWDIDTLFSEVFKFKDDPLRSTYNGVYKWDAEVEMFTITIQ